MTTNLNLRDIPTVVVGRLSDKKRHNHMQSLTKELKLNAQFPDGVTASPNFVGCGISHIRACSQNGIQAPFLLLEDDVVQSPAYSPDLEVPADADMVFLGTTSYGLAPNLDGRALEFAAITEYHNDTFARVHNMLGAHALLFVTERAREAYARASAEYITERFRPHDIALVDLAKELNFYTLIKPSFYQATIMQAKDKKWPAERASKVAAPLRKIGDKVDLKAGAFGRRKMRVVRRAAGHLDWQILKD